MNRVAKRSTPSRGNCATTVGTIVGRMRWRKGGDVGSLPQLHAGHMGTTVHPYSGPPQDRAVQVASGRLVILVSTPDGCATRSEARAFCTQEPTGGMMTQEG